MDGGDWSRRIKWRWQMEMRKGIPGKAANVMGHLRGSMKAYGSGNFHIYMDMI